MSPRRLRRMSATVAAALAVVLVLPGSALGHAERETAFPDGNGSVPTYRTSGPTLLVCKADSTRLFQTLPTSLRRRNERLYNECMDSGFRHIQEAVDAVTEPNSRILVLPGVYKEEPSLEPDADASCAELGDGEGNGDSPGTPGILTYDEQRACPRVQNLIAIFGDGDGDRECDLPVCGLQIEGTGNDPTDVIIDGEFRKLNGIRADRADGVYFRNFALQRFEFNALYIMETDGFVIDRVIGRWNDEYAFLTFADDHGLHTDCEGYGNGDSAVYPGSASDIHADLGLEEADRYAIEIVNCRGHHSTLGYSGTAGNAVHVRDSLFDRNAVGLATDSLFPNHPGLPQDHAYYENNTFESNNRNYYQYLNDGTCDAPFVERGYEHGIVCPVVPLPVGTGMVIAGGNYNRIERNRFYDNWRQGTMQFWVPAALREENDPTKQYDTSHNNRYRDNHMAESAEGLVQPNGLDFWWDDEGTGNCWQDNTSAAGDVTSNATAGLPDCDSGGSQFVPGNPVKQSLLVPCAEFDRNENPDPDGCDWFEVPPRPDGRMPAAAPVGRTTGERDATVATGLSRRAFHDGADAVVITDAADQAETLVAGPLAAEVGGPTLLAVDGRLSPATLREVERLGATRAYVVGELPTAIRGQLEGAGVREVRPIYGRTRYQTAARVARMIGGSEAYIVRGRGTRATPSIADAFSVAGVAALQRRPILLSRRRELPRPTASALRTLDTVNAMLVGSAKKLSADVEKAVAERVVVVDRLDQPERWALSTAAVDLAIQGIADESRVWIADGTRFLDGPVAAPAVARLGGVLLLADGESLADAKAVEWLRANRGVLNEVFLVGGESRISAQAATDIRAALSEQ